jgi:hypothetical protein
VFTERRQSLLRNRLHLSVIAIKKEWGSIPSGAQEQSYAIFFLSI